MVVNRKIITDGPLIKRMQMWLMDRSGTISRYKEQRTYLAECQLNAIKRFCLDFPTCDGCPFQKEHIGCMFRGKTPREW